MKTLFSRVFVSFWLAMGLIVVGGVALTATVAWYRLTTLNEISPDRISKQAAAALHDGGTKFLATWLRGARDAYPGIDVYIVAPGGRDLLNRNMPTRLQKWLAAAKQGEFEAKATQTPAPGQTDIIDDGPPVRPGFQFSAGHLLASSNLTDAEGKVYTLAIAWFGSSPIDVLGSYNIVIVLIALTLVVIAAISWWVARYISAPLKQLQTTAQVIARGQWGAQVDPRISDRPDEIGALARDFNVMATHVKSYIASQEVLLRDISHELRSPLARIRVALGLAEDRQADVGKQFRRIEQDVERLDALIGQMLQLTRLSPSEPKFASEMMEIGSLLQEITEDAQLEASAQDKRVEFADHLQVSISGDRELLRRAVENVVRNAIRYTPPGDKVELSVVQSNGGLSICVRDHGPGVPEHDLERIFDPFYRVDDARDRDTGGSGLGLAISAHVMALHKGTSKAFNMPGGGLMVEMTLPPTKGTDLLDDARIDKAVSGEEVRLEAATT